jgi:hypothetical protein
MRRDARRRDMGTAMAAGGSVMARGNVIMSRAVMAELAERMQK